MAPHIRERFVALASAVVGGLAWASAVLAAPGTVFLTTYLRAGPGEQYAALDEIAPRSQVEVQSCAGNWCRVRAGSATGFVRAEVLAAPDIHAKPPPARNGACFTALLNGRPRGADAVRVCDRE